MTPTELEILRRHAKPGHEDALVDIVTLIVERARAERPQTFLVGEGGGETVQPTCPVDWATATDPSCSGPRVVAMPDGMEMCVGGFDVGHTEARCPHGRRDMHMCPHCMGIATWPQYEGSPNDPD